MSPVLLMGPPGAGKTLTVARLATRLVLAGQPPLVVTADGQRAGAAEQLAAFTRLLGLTLVAADEPVTLARALARRAGQPVLIDTPGLDGNSAADRQTAQMLIAAAAATAALVLPAGLDPAEAADIAEGFKASGVSLLVATRLDQSRRLGGILAAAAKGLALAEAGISANVAAGLTPLTAASLAERLQAGPPGQPAGSAQPSQPKLPPYIRPRNGQLRPAS
jgi:flagellar biosynthesis protein FlhF